MELIKKAQEKLNARRRSRLADAIEIYRKELTDRYTFSSAKHKAKDDSQKVLSLLVMAETALNDMKLDRGWKLFLCAQRMEIYLLDKDVELQARVNVIRSEAGKLREWRKQAIYTLLGAPDKPREVKDPYTVFSAELIRDEHYNNQAYKASLARDFSLWLAGLLILVLVMFFCLVKEGIIKIDPDTINMYYSVSFFGLFGAVVSAVIKQMDMTNTSSTIPETVTTFRIITLRILGGSAFAIVIYIFLRAGVINGIFNESIANMLKAPSSYLVYIIAFCSGFSERLVLKAVNAVGGK